MTTDVTDADGNVTGTTSNTVVTGEILAFTPGLTRNWSYGAAGQTTQRPGYMAMSIYSVTSDGTALDKKQGPSGGLELSYEHTLGHLSKRLEVRLLTGVAPQRHQQQDLQ